MADPVLLLWLEGPMQSWGTRSRWDVRDTGPEPTKSGVIGLIGCAMGLSRDDPALERLDRDLLFGVRVDRPGVFLTDYHTVTGYHRTAAGGFKRSGGTAKSLAKAQEHGESTIVSFRDYLHDAAFLVALAVKPEHRPGNRDLLGHLKERLQNPKWPLYLGRKACVPSRPIFDRLTDEYQNLEHALHQVPWAAPRSRKQRQALESAIDAPKLQAWLECPHGDYERQDSIRLNQLRFYDFRRCRHIEIDTKVLSRRVP
ncbi:MAG: type I-E CRISPR-associated protein Cas5/CasD [Deltaproteobacteria bacterium]|nr:type I-E CRISPR-associated protein Cas5/CasD [Deltaproteobacteria bacterium]